MVILIFHYSFIQSAIFHLCPQIFLKILFFSVFCSTLIALVNRIHGKVKHLWWKCVHSILLLEQKIDTASPITQKTSVRTWPEYVTDQFVYALSLLFPKIQRSIAKEHWVAKVRIWDTLVSWGNLVCWSAVDSLGTVGSQGTLSSWGSLGSWVALVSGGALGSWGTLGSRGA